ncbi:polyketide cyclase [Dyella acidiphila]|uniref:Polyketide cyclase n=1 Tax=Dyella acidiphila TaxID=2775866 RepID=A0ABR9GC92_9GAMM|nr:polyketide cyclase [Dyella acidiphila]MBE1161673.1 polyketide cyclase [Dyella acidiphila]
MMRVLEFIVALLIVVVVGVVVGVIMPGSGHVERSLVVSKDLRQVYDVVNNFRTFPDYSVLRAYDSRTKFTLSGSAYGPGSEIGWSSEDEKVGDGKLTIASSQPEFDKIDPSVNSAQIVWNVDNAWKGSDKHFTLDLLRQGNTGKLTKITWSYDVTYGFSLVARYSNMYIHGQPDAFIQYSLNNLQNVLAAVPNIDYSALDPYIVQTKQTPVLFVSTSMKRKDGLDGLNEATDAAVKQIEDAAKKLGVHTTGPRVIFTTNYGDETYTFDVAEPIDSASLNVGGQSYQLAAPTPPSLADQTAAPASSSTTAAPANADANQPGSKDRYGNLIIDNNVRGMLAYGGPALEAPWNGTAAGVPQTRDMLKAYAQTHGYKYDEVTNRLYDILTQPDVKDASGAITTYAQYAVYLPISDSADGAALPQQTPEQQAGIKQPGILNANGQPASSGTAPAPAGTAPAPASTAAAPAGK